ncbi:NAD(+)/NADH kinase [Actinoplanes sp. TBRC 11911]|uniref:NAD(+)/NADH kinase n=1 Tax=Actinoplanes sp. TBRC 11911 TaxID=2729386 RepID=UPI00145D4F84|nr:NAD(+)/NADH kinase [Actinoplanes sp. TBRC 11911]NMO50024.1 NAD(+)/NADH kinase [Actinoplanes sp. TBRC 11911]
MTSELRVSAVGLVLHPTKSVEQSVDTIVASARGRPIRVLARPGDRDRVPAEVGIVSEAAFVREVDGVIALGGDGTMLGAMRLMIERPVPVLGINHGNLGFLVEVTPAGLPAALARLAAGDFTIEQHACLEVDGVALEARFGFNDVVLSRVGRAGAVSVDLTVNDVDYGYYRADAVVVATPTGSTAYNYAAGGPVLSPSSGAVVVTPVAPISGVSRPIVLGAEDKVALTVAPDSAPVAVDVDGTQGGGAGRGDRLTVTVRPEGGQVVRLSAREYASRSRVKLSLLDLPLRPDQLIELIPAELRRRATEA